MEDCVMEDVLFPSTDVGRRGGAWLSSTKEKDDDDAKKPSSSSSFSSLSSSSPKKRRAAPPPRSMGEEESRKKSRMDLRHSFFHRQNVMGESASSTTIQEKENDSQFLSDFSVPLSENRRVTMSEWKDTVLVNVREYYQQEGSGEWRPSRKGLALNASQLERLISWAPDIPQWIEWVRNKRAAAELPPHEDFVPALRDHEIALKLDTKRRLTIYEFKSNMYMDLRVFYEKDGKWLPTKKGIALTEDQWQTLACRLNDLLEAMQQQQEE